ncbi:glutamate 5-kinase [Wenyingzhuangia heitensis]|uniref:Glutamate 5-kinase n=1 Tax=Wenyingzhuangia heitensis TaxID=1487859 RepID=A0ABX0U6Z9_9FLAO|nr:glutamate 5-kinase [Wenyingzhuangia heitensis]NIJ44528.1 glutamate 5-kinase [Wenyingzhuangia heitensis]
MKTSKKILIKIGSNVLTLPSGAPNEERIKHIVEQVAFLKKEGHQVVLVSSGAVAAGRSKIEVPSSLDAISKRQVLASVGQIALMNLYNQYFTNHQLICSQVLITKESFSTREHYLNMTNCVEALLKCDITPIINENDVVSVTELMFTDNDEISGLVASMIQADELLILSNVDGIFTDHPSKPDALLIRDFDNEEIDLDNAISEEKSEFGRGGMLTKVNTAIKIAALGVNVSIGNGTTPNITAQLLKREAGTFFKAHFDKNKTAVKKWITNSGTFSKGKIFINKGAYNALLNNQANSLLPVGIEKIEGAFKKGDIVTILDLEGNEIGYGKASYGAEKALVLQKQHNQPALVHYNYLTIK